MELSLTASAQFPDAVWDTLTTDTLQDRLTPQAIAVNGYEEFHLAYAKSRVGGGWNIYYRHFDLFRGISPEVVAESDMPCFTPVAASRYSDNDYDIAIFFESGEDIWGCINHSPEESWEFVNITNSRDPDLSPTVAIGSNYLHVAWITYTNSQYKISYNRGREDSSWTEIIQDSELGEFGAGAQPFIMALVDVPHIFYRGVNNGGYHIHHAYKPNPDSSWVIEYVMTPNADDYSATAVRDIVWDIHLAVSGNGGFGFPGRVYYRKLDHETGQWSNSQLVTGQYSATNASIFARPGNLVYVASCGVSGNIFDGNIFLSDYSGGSFQTQLLANYRSCTQPVMADITGEHAVLIFDAPVGPDEQRNIELVYYGPELEPVAVHEPVPTVFSQSRCYPNPFNSRLNIEFGISQPLDVRVDVFDISGRKVAEIFQEALDAGNHHVVWDADGCASGIYFYRIQAGESSQTQRMVLLK
jgi:hypothetical protein